LLGFQNGTIQRVVIFNLLKNIFCKIKVANIATIVEGQQQYHVTTLWNITLENNQFSPLGMILDENNHLIFANKNKVFFNLFSPQSLFLGPKIGFKLPYNVSSM